MAPASAVEDRLLAEILSFTFYDVDRLPDADMAQAQMQAQQCHNNAFAYAAQDPSGESKAVSGWWKRDGIFLLHSVVLTHSRLVCVTPHPSSPAMEFAPDPRIEWEYVGGQRVARRDGTNVPDVVRLHPAETMAAARRARDLLLSETERPTGKSSV